MTPSENKSESAPPGSSRGEDTGHNNPSHPPARSKPYQPPPGGETAAGDPTLTVRLKSLRRGLRSGIWVLLGALSLAGLLLYLLVLDFLSRLQELPLVLQGPAWGLVAVASGFVIWALFRLLKFWLALQSFRQVELVSPYRISEVLGKDLKHLEANQKTLSRYLAFLSNQAGTQQHWEKIWPEKAEVQPTEVLVHVNRLLEPRSLDTLSWTRELETRVLTPLDQVARSRIRHYARRVGLKTAISPFPLVDSLAVLYNASLLIQDLASLYGRRLNRAETTLLLLLILFQVYVAGEAQELAESGLDEVHSLVSEGMSGITNRMTAFFSPKIAEGVLNAYILYRLGHYARRQFRPIRSRKKKSTDAG